MRLVCKVGGNFRSFNLPEGLNVHLVASESPITDSPLVQESRGWDMEREVVVGQIRDGSLPGYKHSESTINGPTLNQLSRLKPVFIFINRG